MLACLVAVIMAVLSLLIVNAYGSRGATFHALDGRFYSRFMGGGLCPPAPYALYHQSIQPTKLKRFLIMTLPLSIYVLTVVTNDAQIFFQHVYVNNEDVARDYFDLLSAKYKDMLLQGWSISLKRF